MQEQAADKDTLEIINLVQKLNKFQKNNILSVIIDQKRVQTKEEERKTDK